VKDEILNIFANTECFSEDDLYKYTKNELSEKQIRIVERHLADCEMCSDVVEGLSNMKNKSELNTIVENINIQIDKKLDVLNSKNKIIYFNFKKIISIAAIIVLLLGISFLLNKNFNQKNNYLSQEINTEKKEAIIENKDADKSDNAPTLKNDTETKQINEKTKVSKKKYIDEINNNISTGLEEAKSQVLAEEVSESENLTSDVMVETMEDNIYSKATSVLSAPVFANINTIIAEEQNLKSTNNVGLALEDFTNENYKKAKTNFETEINENPNNDTAIFYNGLTEYQLQNFDKATKIFDQIIENPKSNFYESALYFKALTLINTNNKKEALNILNKVINLNAKYYDLANEQIKDLKK